MISLRKDKSERSGIELLITEIIVLGQKSAEIRDDMPLDILEDLFEFVFIEVAKRLYHEPEKFNARYTIEQYTNLFINAVRPENGQRYS